MNNNTPERTSGTAFRWDAEADVVIVGYGGAGACAAIAGHDAGVETRILEKAPAGGGNTATAGPGFTVARDVDAAVEFYRALTWGTVDEELLRAMAESTRALPGLLEKLGAEVKLLKHKPTWYASFPGADAFQTVHLPRAAGRGGDKTPKIPGAWLFHLLENQVRKRGVAVHYQTPATGLVQDPQSREVLGVKAVSDAGKEICVKARHGVILACGGFENNREMLTQFLPFTVALPIYPMGTPYNTGDGIRMAGGAGASLWHMTSVEFGNFAPKAPGEKFGLGFRLVRRLPAGGTAIYVNKYGRRFMDESQLLSHRKEFFRVQAFDTESAEYPNIPFFMVFDEAFRKRGPLVGRNDSWWNLRDVYRWSDDNSAEIESGWIERADTINQLAGRINVPPEALEATVREYNRACAQKEDTEFGRAREWLVPIESPPFYATELCEPIINTQGGPKHDARARVLDGEDKPIPRLFAAGELGSMFFPLYLVGGNVPEALAFGTIAGEQAAALAPWD
ncbi:MAG: FAD-binding protein [Chloroflexota bacterium]